jgi:hypothetical protein
MISLTAESKKVGIMAVESEVVVTTGRENRVEGKRRKGWLYSDRSKKFCCAVVQ